MAAGSPMSAEQMAAQAQAQNQAASMLITAKGVRMRQQIATGTIVPANTPFVNVQPRYVGLLMGFWVKISFTVQNNTGGGTAITPTDFGAANILSPNAGVQMNDLDNLIRIQTAGWHLNFLNSVKGHFPYAAALLNNTLDGLNVSGSYGANWTVISEPATIADTASGTSTMWYYVPSAYGEQDYRGAIFVNVVNATMQLTLTWNTTPVGNSAADTTNNIFKAAAGAGTITSLTYTVYQDYIDQIPAAQGQYILPALSMATVYELKQTVQTAITAGNDFPVQYPNFRSFLSTFAIYNSNPAVSGGRGVGADINYWALQAANMTNLFKVEPALVALWTRAQIRTDLPKGVYYFPSRIRPIETTQYGNMQLVVNPITAAAGAYELVGWESFGVKSVITQAGSLPAS